MPSKQSLHYVLILVIIGYEYIARLHLSIYQSLHKDSFSWQRANFVDRLREKDRFVGMRLARKVVVVGDKGCGKTSLVALFQGEPFTEGYEPTVFDNKELKIKTEVRSAANKKKEANGTQNQAEGRRKRT